MKTILILCLVLLSLNVSANYSKFTSCYFQNHNFTQSVAQYVHDQVVQNKVVIFDDTPIGFSGRTVSNKGFYLDYDVENCNINFSTMMSSCAIKPDTLVIKYGTRPSYLEPVYLSTICQTLDRTNLDSFLSAIVSYPLFEGLEISSLGILGLNSDDNLVFRSSPFQVSFASAPAPAVYSPCPNPNVSWIGSTANQVTVDSVEVYGEDVELNFYLSNGVIDAFATDYVCSYYYDPEAGEEIEDCNLDFSSHVFINEADRGKQFTIENDFVYVQFRLTGFTSNFSHNLY